MWTWEGCPRLPVGGHVPAFKLDMAISHLDVYNSMPCRAASLSLGRVRPLFHNCDAEHSTPNAETHSAVHRR